MQWFKHMTTSHQDPDISDAWDQFGDSGPLFFWNILEIYGREFNNVDEDGWLWISTSYLRRQTRKKLNSWRSLLSFYKLRQRILFKEDGKLTGIKVPKFIDISSNWTKRPKLKKEEEPTEVPTAIEEEVEVEEEKRIKEQSKKIFEDLKILASKVAKKYEGFNPYEAIQKAVNNGHLVEDIKPALEYMLTNQVDNTWGCFNRITAKEKRLRLENEREQNWEQRKIDDKRKVADLIRGIGK